MSYSSLINQPILIQQKMVSIDLVEYQKLLHCLIEQEKTIKELREKNQELQARLRESVVSPEQAAIQHLISQAFQTAENVLGAE